MTCGVLGKKGPHWNKGKKQITKIYEPRIQNVLKCPSLEWKNAQPMTFPLGRFGSLKKKKQHKKKPVHFQRIKTLINR